MEITHKINNYMLKLHKNHLLIQKMLIILIFTFYVAYLAVMYFVRADGDCFTELEQTNFYLYEPIKDTSVNLLYYGNNLENCVVDVDIIEIWWDSDYIIPHCRNYDGVESYYIVFACFVQDKSDGKIKVVGPLEYKELVKERDILEIKLNKMKYRNLLQN